jgi:hypothetical protein
MSLSTMRTPDMRLSLDHIENSPRGTRFLLLIPDAEPELEGRQCWPVDFEDDFTFYLERSGNRSILTGIKREDCRYWLRNPSRQLRGDTAALRVSDANKRHCILAYFELQDNQVYRKSEMIKGKLFPARYAVCIWDSYEIITRVHRALKHFG